MLEKFEHSKRHTKWIMFYAASGQNYVLKPKYFRYHVKGPQIYDTLVTNERIVTLRILSEKHTS